MSPSNEYSGLISFRMDWLDLLAVQGTLNLQHHSLGYRMFNKKSWNQHFSKGDRSSTEPRKKVSRNSGRVSQLRRELWS